MNLNSFENISVKITAHLLSHRVATAIKVALRNRELVSTTGLNAGRCLLKLSDKYLNLNSFEKMILKLAAHSATTAIIVALASGEIVYTTGLNTCLLKLTNKHLNLNSFQKNDDCEISSPAVES